MVALNSKVFSLVLHLMEEAHMIESYVLEGVKIRNNFFTLVDVVEDGIDSCGVVVFEENSYLGGKSLVSGSSNNVFLRGERVLESRVGDNRKVEICNMDGATHIGPDVGEAEKGVEGETNMTFEDLGVNNVECGIISVVDACEVCPCVECHAGVTTLGAKGKKFV